MSVVVIVLAAGLLAWFTYWRLERLGRRAWLAALCRGIAWAALGVLLLDLSCAIHGGVGRRPLVLLDGSLSMAAAGGQWRAALDSARAWGEVRLFGDAGPAGDSLPTLGRSDLAPALRAAAASDRRVIVVTDGELDDAQDLPPELLQQVTVRTFPRHEETDLAITRLEGPARATAGDTLRLEAEVAGHGSAPDTVRLEVREGNRVLLRQLARLGGAGVVTVPLPVPSTGLSGDVLLTVALPGRDSEPRDDARWWIVRVMPTPGIVVLANPPDWDARFLFRVLRDVAALPVRGYERVSASAWRSEETLAEVTPAEVRQAADRADVLVVKGAAPALARDSRARGRWLWPSGEAGEPVIPGEWYARGVATSPVAGAFVGLPVDSFPPLIEITPIVPGPDDWVALTAQLGRRGADRPIFVGRQEGNVRRVTMAADGLWRWAFRGGSSEQSYRALVANTLSWLLGGADSASGLAHPVRPVVPNGRPLTFQWNGTGTPRPVGIVLRQDTLSRRDTLRFDGAGHARLWLPTGRYRYSLDGGGGGLVAVDTWSGEWAPRPVVLHDHEAPALAAVGFSSSRRWIWLFGLAVLGLSGEWIVRRRLGLR